MEDLVSIIVPVYNVEKYIHKCIDSIINQTYTNLEIILVDDGSPDNCGKICDEYAKKDKRIKVIHKENGGVSSARNIGIKLSKGQWISFIDSDDWIENRYFEIMIKQAKKQYVDIVLCTYNRVSKNNVEKINIIKKDKLFNAREYLINSLNPQTGFGFCHMKLIKKECIKDIRFNSNLVVGEDALFNIQLSNNISKAFFIKETLYNYRNNSNSAVKRYDKNYVNKYLESMKTCKNYITSLYTDKEIMQSYYNYVVFHVMLIAVNYCYNLHNPVNNKKKLLKEICNNEVFKEAIRKSNYKNISLTRQITLFTLKHKLYFCVELICKYRQKQNMKGNN